MAHASKHIFWFRHSQSLYSGRLYGRTDVAATEILPETAQILKKLVPKTAPLYSSPARRCMYMAKTLFPEREAHIDADLWEQNFGIWEGKYFKDIDDVGDVSLHELARLTPAGGENFFALARRVETAINSLPSGPSIIIAHAGVIRAALGLALGQIEHGLCFEISNLSLTETVFFPDKSTAKIGSVNVIYEFLQSPH